MAGLEKARKTHAELMALLDTVPGVKEHMESAEVKADLERYRRLVEDVRAESKMRKCPYCSSEIISTDVPCIFCDGEICRHCWDYHGMTTIVQCVNDACVLGDDETEVNGNADTR